MKHVILFLFSICFSLMLQAQISKTVEVTAGTLKTVLTTTELNTITNLTLTGIIDARDFNTMREMPNLAELDLSEVIVVEYCIPVGREEFYCYAVNTIPEGAFNDKTSLTSILLPASLSSIGTGAFSGCNKLTSFVLPSSLTSIGEGAFSGCSSLTSIVIPSSISSIQYGTFSDCYGLTTVTIPSSVTSIGGYAFAECYGLTSIVIPSSVKSIGDLAFIGCTGLTGTLTIPSSVTTIGASVFNGCSGLTGTLTIPSSVTSIDYGAFEGCSGFNSLAFNSSDISIGSYAFRGFSSLNSIYIYSISPINLSSSISVFYDVNKSTAKLYVSYGSSGLYAAEDQWKDFTNIIEMPGFSLSETSVNLSSDAGSTATINITSDVIWEADCDQPWLNVNYSSGIGINPLSFIAEANTLLSTRRAIITISASGVVSQTITITQEGLPKMVNVTAGDLFSDLTNSELSTTSNLKLTGTIDARDFKTMRDNMPMLSTLDLSGVTVVAYTGTAGTKGTSSIEYPANTIPGSAFRGKTILQSIYLPSLVTTIGSFSFMDCSGLTGTFDIPPSVTNIEEAAFQVCTGLSSLTIPSSVTTIGNYAFNACSGLTSSLVIPSSISTIGEAVFQSCSKLSSVDIPSSVTSIQGSAFDGCSGLTSVTIPMSVTSIGNYAFNDCNRLTSIVIPSSVTSIGFYAYRNCGGLISIFANSLYPVELPFPNPVFEGVSKTTCILYVPNGSKALYANANQWKDFMNIVEMPGIILSATTANLASIAGSTATVDITSNTTWIASTDLAWLNLSPVSGTNNGTIMIIANSANTGTNPRTGTVKLTFSGLIKDITDYVTITQENQYDPEIFSEYLFEESSGTTVIDSKGSNDGTIINNASRVDGVQGGGLEFTGSGYVNLGQVFGDNVQNELTLSAWIKPASTGNNYQGVIMHGGPKTDSYALYIRSDSKEIGFKTSGTSNAWLTVKNVNEFWDGNWHHLAVTYNGLQKIIYLDNTPILTEDATGIIESGTGYNLLIGAGRDEETPTLLYKGLIDEVRIYNYALTSEQIVDLYDLVNSTCPQHFQTVWEGTLGLDHMNINVIGAQYDGLDLEPGDEIGIFDGSLCVGYGKLTKTIDQQNILSIKTSRDDGTGNGYISGHSVSYSFWDCSAGLEYIVTNIQCFNIQLSPITCLPFVSSGTAFVELSSVSEICQTLQFDRGWNVISVPNNSSTAKIETIFQPLKENNSLVKIQDEAGNSFENWGIFGGWQDNIENMSPTKGYKIKVRNIGSIEICGKPVNYPYAIPLQTGWNIMGYPQTTAFNAQDVVQKLIDRNTLIKLQDEAGNSIEDWGIFGGWQNKVGNFAPGKGFNIKVNAKDTLWIYESYPKSSAILPEQVATTHFAPEFEGNGVDHMNINLVGLPINLLKAGDELAVFDGTTCVGAVTILPHHIKSQTVSIAASANDNQGMAGFEEGNPITLKLWDSKNNREFILEPEIIKGPVAFTKHETAIASMEKYTTTGIVGLIDHESTEVKCYPNPFSHRINIEINLATDAQIQVEVLNQLGQRVKMITTKQPLPGGLNKFDWDGKNAGNQVVSPGIYHVRVNIDGICLYRKIVFSK